MLVTDMVVWATIRMRVVIDTWVTAFRVRVRVDHEGAGLGLGLGRELILKVQG